MGAYWPDWRGRTACVIAAGASARDTVARLGARRPLAIAVNRSFELAPWADALYAADGAFWDTYPHARGFPGLRLTASEWAAREHKLQHVSVVEYAWPEAWAPQFDLVGRVGHGGNSGFQALNLVAQLGATRIVLIGFDLQGSHWHSDHEGLRNPGHVRLAEWAAILDDAAPAYAARGVEIVNASDRSALEAYPHVAIEDAFAEHATA